MQEIANMVNMRFGPGTWQGIINERARRIQEQKEIEKEERLKRRKAHQEMAENIKTMGIVVMSIATFVVLATGLFLYNSHSR